MTALVSLAEDDAEFADFFSNPRTLRHLRMISEGRQLLWKKEIGAQGDEWVEGETIPRPGE